MHLTKTQLREIRLKADSTAKLLSGLENFTDKITETKKHLLLGKAWIGYILRDFAPLDITTEEAIWVIAERCHEANKTYCESIGDNSQLSWDKAPDWQKKSAVTGVQFHIENPKAGPSGSHESWLAEKEKDGWKYGEVKDPEKKTHPCYVPFAELPEEQRLKDVIFTSIVHEYIKDYSEGPGNKNPYENTKNASKPEEIEKTADVAEVPNFNMIDRQNDITKINALRKTIGELIDEISSLESTHNKAFCLMHFTEARFMLGFRLQEIREGKAAF